MQKRLSSYEFSCECSKRGYESFRLLSDGKPESSVLSFGASFDIRFNQILFAMCPDRICLVNNDAKVWFQFIESVIFNGESGDGSDEYTIICIPPFKKERIGYTVLAR